MSAVSRFASGNIIHFAALWLSQRGSLFRAVSVDVHLIVVSTEDRMSFGLLCISVKICFNSVLAQRNSETKKDADSEIQIYI